MPPDLDEIDRSWLRLMRVDDQEIATSSSQIFCWIPFEIHRTFRGKRRGQQMPPQEVTNKSDLNLTLEIGLSIVKKYLIAGLRVRKIGMEISGFGFSVFLGFFLFSAQFGARWHD